jgi:hypothetical protein
MPLNEMRAAAAFLLMYWMWSSCACCGQMQDVNCEFPIPIQHPSHHSRLFLIFRVFILTAIFLGNVLLLNATLLTNILHKKHFENKIFTWESHEKDHFQI